MRTYELSNLPVLLLTIFDSENLNIILFIIDNKYLLHSLRKYREWPRHKENKQCFILVYLLLTLSTILKI